MCVHLHLVALAPLNSQIIRARQNVKGHVIDCSVGTWKESIMKLLRLIFTLNIVVQALGLPKCQDVQTGEFCHEGESYDKSYPAEPLPQSFDQKVHIYDIFGFDEDKQTLTLFIEFRVEWNDTRILLKSIQDPKWSEIDNELAALLYFPTIGISNAERFSEIDKISSTKNTAII